jgi:hypothetical protein
MLDKKDEIEEKTEPGLLIDTLRYHVEQVQEYVLDLIRTIRGNLQDHDQDDGHELTEVDPSMLQLFRERLPDLFDVGPDKPFGYMPIEAIVMKQSCPLEQVRAALEQQGLHTFIAGVSAILDRARPSTRSGDLYAYHPPSLQALLDNHAGILHDNGWPQQVDQFVRRVAREDVPSSNVGLFGLIEQCFERHVPAQD